MNARKRVLCLTSNFPRWAGDSTTPFVLHLCQDLAQQGFDVDVLAPHAPGAAFAEDLAGVHVERFQYAWPASAQTVCYQGGALVNLRRRPFEKLKLPALVLAEWSAAQARLLRGDYDLVHSHWVLPQGFVGMIASGLCNVPHVVTLHGGDLFALRAPALEQLKRWALLSASAVTVNSSFTEERTRKLAPRLREIERIPMGVDDAPLSERELNLTRSLRQQHQVGDGPLFVFVGRLVDEKGGEDAIRALALVRETRPQARLLVVGEGQDGARLRALAADLGLEQEVRFLGWVQPTELRAHFAAADSFWGPSRTAADGWVEAQGLTFLEAMVAGVPVVASRLGGIVDAVRDGETGLLVDERSPEQLAAAALRLLDSPALRRSLIEAGTRLVQAQFSRVQSAQRFARLYRACLEPGS